MSYRSKRTLNVLAAKSSTAAQSLDHLSSSAATAQPASSLKASESLVQQQPPVLCLTSSGALRPPTQPLWPPTAVAGTSAEVPGRFGQKLPPPGIRAGASKLIVQQQPVGLTSQPSLQPQPTASIAALRPIYMPTSLTGAAQPLIRPSTIRFGPFQLSFAIRRSNPPSDKGFDKRVLKHVAKHFKQYKHGLKRDYFKPEEKTREDMHEIVLKEHSHDGWMRLVDYWCSKQHEVEAHGRDPTHLEFFVANTATEGFLNEVTSKVQEQLLTSSPSKTQVEIENEMSDELMYEEENPKQPIGFGFNIDRSDVFGVNVVLRKRGYTFPDNNMELKRVKEESTLQKAMFLLMLKAVRNEEIIDEFLDATEAALYMAGDQSNSYDVFDVDTDGE
ncbi:hypothetical protein Cgig2_002033 [Carnegiea gigantea]|uniref:Uncharacterized protein n=1 Tax=Carnegiea gigantea TaxID=171969 RepID=A0A9Q1GX18_9CARY|nr:hypothetical protein Cgig2_002033 [Carnegiea gigantea]